MIVKNGQILVPQSTIDEIVRQEFQIAKDKVLRTDAAVHADEIILVQTSMDSILPFRIDSVSDVSKMLGYFICELAGLCQPTDAATEMLWRVVQRIVATKGLFLAVPSWKMVKTAIWSESPNFLIALIEKNIIPVLVGGLDSRPRKDTKRRSAEQESRPSSN